MLMQQLVMAKRKQAELKGATSNENRLMSCSRLHRCRCRAWGQTATCLCIFLLMLLV